MKPHGPLLLILVVLCQSCAVAHAAPPADSLGVLRHRIRENAIVDTLPTVEVIDTFDRVVRRVPTQAKVYHIAADRASPRRLPIYARWP